MAFLRRKSGVYHEDIYVGDPEPQPKHERRRLSKPNVGTFSDPSSFSSQQYTGQKIIIRAEHDHPIGSIANDSREIVRAHLFSSTSPSNSDLESTRSKSRAMGMMSAYMATTISNDNSTQPSSSQTSLVSPTLPTLPISRMLSAKRASENHRPSISSLGSKDRYANDLDLGNVSPPSSNEQLASDPAPPARKPALYTPGMATRQPNTQKQATQKEPESTVNLAEAVIMRKTSVKDVPTVEHELTWSPPSPSGHERSGTPANMNVTHIGRLGLGSLHITNGRASPAPSDVSKTAASFWPPTVRRETSSCYPESEIGTIKSRKTLHSDWEDEPLPSLSGDSSLRSRPDIQRNFSFNPGAESSFNKTGRVPSIPLPGIDASILAPPAVAPPEDKTKFMAEQYISDLPKSPFSESPPASPVLPVVEVNSDANELTPPQTPTNARPVPSLLPQAQEDPSSPVSMGSVRRYSDRANGRRSFIDETLAQSPTPDRAISPASFFSVPEPEEEQDLPFASAVEIQPTRERSMSPRKAAARLPLPPARDSREGSRGPISDSGYSSNTSLGVILPPNELRTPTGNENNVEKDKRRLLRFPFQKMQKSGKPVLVKPTPSTKVPSPTSVRIESVSALTSQASFLPTEASRPNSSMSLPASPVKTKEKRKKLIKLRRKSTAEAAGELVVQRLTSVDCLSIPPVSATSKNSLAQKAQAIPELDRTYRTQNHTARSANASVLSLTTAAKELRFPSPQPEEEERDGRNKRSSSRSRSRGRSFSRPRSWINWPKRDKSGSRANSKDRENQKSELNDFGSVAGLLGDNPYDIAGRSRTAMPPSAWNNRRPNFLRRQTTPSNITSNNPRPRSSMDDQTASILSSLRRRSTSERDSRNSSQERGGAPWKPSNDIHTPADVPPLPALPSEEEINRRFSYRHGYATHPRPLSYRSNTPSQRNSQIYEDDQQPQSQRNSQIYEDDQQRYGSDRPQYEEGLSQYEMNQYSELHFVDEPREAPPPPPHSPRPMYLENENQANYVDEPEHIYSHEEAPLPPRHSPMPSYLDDESGFEHAIEDEGPAPPPPSHSPRPTDITADQRPQSRSRDPSWSSPANAWNLRRQSAGEALKQSWGKLDQYYGVSQSANEPERQRSNPIVPRRKPVPSQWMSQESNQEPSYHEWRSDDLQQQDDGPNGRHARDSTYTQSPAQYQPRENDSHPQEQHYDQFEQPYHDQYQDQNNPKYSQQGYNDNTHYQQQRTVVQRRPLPQQHQSNQHNYYQEYNNNHQQQYPQYPNHHTERQTTYPSPSHYNNNNNIHQSPAGPRPNSRHSQTSRQSQISHRSHTADIVSPEFYSPSNQQYPQYPKHPQHPQYQNQHQHHHQQSSPLPPTQPGIGRYSGGLDLTYDTFPRFENMNSNPNPGVRPRSGVGMRPTSISPVRRSGTPKREGKRHSWIDMESYGRDLDDVPGVPLLVGNVGGRMIYR